MVGADGRPPLLGPILLREILPFVSVALIVGLAGVGWALFDADERTWFDILAGTRVVRTPAKLAVRRRVPPVARAGWFTTGRLRLLSRHAQLPASSSTSSARRSMLSDAPDSIPESRCPSRDSGDGCSTVVVSTVRPSRSSRVIVSTAS